jgi:hypothetical protein
VAVGDPQDLGQEGRASAGPVTREHLVQRGRGEQAAGEPPGDRGDKLAPRRRRRNLEDRPRRRADPQALVALELAPVDLLDAMHPDPPAASAIPAHHADFHLERQVREEAPDGRRGAVAEERALPARQQRALLAGQRRQNSAAIGVHAVEHNVHTPAGHAPFDRALADPARVQLLRAHDRALPRGDATNHPIDHGTDPTIGRRRPAKVGFATACVAQATLAPAGRSNVGFATLESRGMNAV